MKTAERILIFGATSAIAQACARQLLADGASLYLVGRSDEKLKALTDDLRVRSQPGQVVAGEAADLDVVHGHAGLLASAERALGGIDAVLIAQGHLPDQSACTVAPEMVLRSIHTNALAPIALAEATASIMEAHRHGQIVVIGSVAGDRGRQSNYVYGSAKGMLALHLQGLRNRLHPMGINVLTIKPGFVDTPMTASFNKKGLLWASPEQVARGIVRAMRNREDVVYIPGFWRWIMLLIKCVPERVFKRLKL